MLACWRRNGNVLQVNEARSLEAMKNGLCSFETLSLISVQKLGEINQLQRFSLCNHVTRVADLLTGIRRPSPFTAACSIVAQLLVWLKGYGPSFIEDEQEALTIRSGFCSPLDLQRITECSFTLRTDVHASTSSSLLNGVFLAESGQFRRVKSRSGHRLL